MLGQESVMKTPCELELQKLNLLNLSQFKNSQLEYHILSILSQALSGNDELVSTAIYFRLFNELLTFDDIQAIRMLPLFEKYSYELWNNQAFSIEIREKTSFYKIISNWIINFELRSGKLDTVESQFLLVIGFMQKETRSMLQRLVMMEEIFEDLKELIDEQFWQEEEQIRIEASSFGKFKNQLKGEGDKDKEKEKKEQACSESQLSTIQVIFQLIEAIMNPLYYRVSPKNSLHKNCIYSSFTFSNVKTFIKRCIFFILKQGNIPTHLQTQLTRISLIYLQFLTQEESSEMLNLIKHLMLGTSKAVRFALVVEYVQFYEYLQLMGFEEVIQQLENLIYFRELIIGKKIVEESIMEIGNNINDVNLSYHQLYLKAGTTKRVYFSNEFQDCVLKLDVFVEENDINMKICFFDNIVIESKPAPLSKFISQTVTKINNYEGSKLKPERVYWQEEKSTSKKLQLRLQYQGIYWLQFDNSYSWVIPKNIKYRLELYEPLK